ncbi:MAG: DNA repair and recombination protein RadB [Candidatus Woesearchaeota archaeon]|nr:MAG: DNA repair and recombination protein RadB [Candidatus Woesearchaeota archaeon]
MKISTGSALFDQLLGGGFDPGCITTIFGPAASGKTSLALCACAHVPPHKKIVYIDTEGSFSLERFKQLAGPTYKEKLAQILIYKPSSFKEQKDAFAKLENVVDKTTHLIILDSVAMLYRLEIGQTKNVYEVNRELGMQLALLMQISRKRNIPALITNQVYQDFEDKTKLSMVGGDIMRYSSKTLIEFQILGKGVRRAILRRHRFLRDGNKITFRIVDQGFEEADYSSPNGS